MVSRAGSPLARERISDRPGFGIELERLLSLLPDSPTSAVALLQDRPLRARVEQEARALGLYPLVARALPEVFELKHEELLAARFFAARLERATAEATGALESAGIQAIAFKGAVLGSRLYPEPALRPATDVDLLVRPADADAAKAALEKEGWWLEYDPRSRPLDFQHSINFRKRGVMLELHWVLVSGFQGRFDSERIFARSGFVQLGGRVVRVLGREDELVHQGAHAATHIFAGAKWLYDLKLAVRAGGFSWREVIALASEARVRSAVGMALWEARRRVGAAVPSWALEKLAPGPARRIAARGIEAIPVAYPRSRSFSLDLLLADRISPQWALHLTGPAIKRAALGVNRFARMLGLPSPVSDRFEPATGYPPASGSAGRLPKE